MFTTSNRQSLKSITNKHDIYCDVKLIFQNTYFSTSLLIRKTRVDLFGLSLFSSIAKKGLKKVTENVKKKKKKKKKLMTTLCGIEKRNGKRKNGSTLLR